VGAKVKAKGGFMYSRILMPTDGSPASQKALSYGLELARFLGSEVTLLYALPQVNFIPTALGSLVLPFDLDRQAATEQVLSQAQKMASEAGVKAKLEGVAAYPVPSILEAARSHELILMSSGGAEGWPMGSVTHEILQRSPIPVLVVRQATPIPPPAHRCQRAQPAGRAARAEPGQALRG
jgi:nucleotide-binding universal stress UspA family protein